MPRQKRPDTAVSMMRHNLILLLLQHTVGHFASYAAQRHPSRRMSSGRPREAAPEDDDQRPFRRSPAGIGALSDLCGLQAAKAGTHHHDPRHHAPILSPNDGSSRLEATRHMDHRAPRLPYAGHRPAGGAAADPCRPPARLLSLGDVVEAKTKSRRRFQCVAHQSRPKTLLRYSAWDRTKRCQAFF